MKSKVIKIFSGLILLVFIGIIVQSCCRDMDRKICSMRFQSYPYGGDSLDIYNQNLEDQIDTSFGQFKFNLIGEVAKLNDVCFNPNIITKAYATQPCLPNIIDSVPRSNMNLSLDRDVVFNNTTVPAGSNLIVHAATSIAVLIESYSYYSYEVLLSMDSTNFKLMHLDTGIYKVALVATTTRGETFNLERQVVYKR